MHGATVLGLGAGLWQEADWWQREGHALYGAQAGAAPHPRAQLVGRNHPHHVDICGTDGGGICGEPDALALFLRPPPMAARVATRTGLSQAAWCPFPTDASS